MEKQALTWNDHHHNIGIRSIDEQHRQMVALVNALNDAIAHNRHWEEVKAKLEELLHFTATHFAHEENLMRDHGFPHLKQHEAEHQALLAHATNLLNKITPTRPVRVAIASAYLTDWAEHHILHADKEVGQFLTDKGMK